MNPLSLVIDRVTVVYPSGLAAIEDVSLSLSGGSIYGLLGVNGAGKSTLLKCMMGFIKPQSGSVLINDQPIAKALKNNVVAYVPQAEEVDWNFPVLVDDVVMMGRYGSMGLMRIPSARDRAAVEEAMGRMGILSLRRRPIAELSGGQKKRMFVARALAQQARIILLDEPFTGVDVNTEETLLVLFKSLANEGAILVVSTHNLASVPHFCDHVILLNRRVVAAGPTQDTFTPQHIGRAFGGGAALHAIST